MLSEFVNVLVELGQQAKQVSTAPCPWNKNNVLIIKPDGTLDECEKEKPPRGHHVSDLGSLRACIERYGESSVIWVAFNQLYVVLNDKGYRDNTIFLLLDESPLFDSLAGFGKTNDPKKLYRFLKYDCKDSAIDPPDLDLLISNLKFRTEDELSREVGKTADKMGQSIRSEVTGADKIPDLVSFTFLPWPGIEEEFQAEETVPCQLYIDPSERTISLKPLAGAIDAAKTAAVTTLANRLRQKWKLPDCPVLCGTP